MGFCGGIHLNSPSSQQWIQNCSVKKQHHVPNAMASLKLQSQLKRDHARRAITAQTDAE
jgi:hypothetical protein